MVYTESGINYMNDEYKWMVMSMAQVTSFKP